MAILRVSVTDSEADEGLAYNELLAGAAPKPIERFDNAYDVRAFLSGPVEAYFDHTGESGYDALSNRLWHDFRSSGNPNKSWTLAVKTSVGRTVTLEWSFPNADIRCDTHRFILDDGGSMIDLCAQAAYQFLNTSNAVRKMTLRIF